MLSSPKGGPTMCIPTIYFSASLLSVTDVILNVTKNRAAKWAAGSSDIESFYLLIERIENDVNKVLQKYCSKFNCYARINAHKDRPTNMWYVSIFESSSHRSLTMHELLNSQIDPATFDLMCQELENLE